MMLVHLGSIIGGRREHLLAVDLGFVAKRPARPAAQAAGRAPLLQNFSTSYRKNKRAVFQQALAKSLPEWIFQVSDYPTYAFKLIGS
jgi:hypothetical protein